MNTFAMNVVLSVVYIRIVVLDVRQSVPFVRNRGVLTEDIIVKSARNLFVVIVCCLVLPCQM
jgi:hypothetical protein